MPIDESQLANHPSNEGAVILDDETCPKCGYNLKGLRRSGVCPECGHGITARKRGKRSLMIHAPRGYLRSLVVILLIMAWAGVGAFVVSILPTIIFMLPILRVTPIAGKVSGMALIGAFIASLGWTLGTILLCRTRPTENDTIPEDRRLIPYIIFTQPLWPVAFALAGIGMSGIADGTVFTIAYLCALPAAFGLVPTALRLSEFADWADDLNLSMHFRAVGLALGACAIIDALYRLSLATDFLLTFLIFLVWVFALIVFAGAWFVLSWRCLQLAGDARWAIINAKDADARDARLAEKARHDQQAQNRKTESQRHTLESTTTDTSDLPLALESDSTPAPSQIPDAPEHNDDSTLYRLEDP